MSDKINKIQVEIIEEFSNLDDWLDKYEHLIELGKSLNPSDEKLKLEENLLNGCQSNIWIKAENQNDIIHYSADSDSLITKGIISLILRVLNEQNVQDIVDTDLYFLDKIGLKSNLSPTRANGLITIIKKIKNLSEELKKE
jgi:cysteine desulfuration protein SufE